MPKSFDQSDSNPRIILAGLGMVSVLADNAWTTFRRLLDGRTMDQRLEHFEQPNPDPVDLVRYVGSAAVADHVADDPAVELAERAIRQACIEAGVEPRDCAAVLGASKGAVTRLGQTARQWQAGHPLSERDAAAVALGPHGFFTMALQNRLGLAIHGHRVAACASGLAALDAARRWMLQPDGPEQVIVATAEAALTPIYINSYRRLGVLASTMLADYRHRPLDQRRSGFRLCQLAAAVVLKKENNAVPSQTHAVELLDTALAAEAFDMIRPDPSMAAVRRIANQLFKTQAIDVLHPHAPGTTTHDPAELAALVEVHRQYHAVPPTSVYANKGAIGHGMGAAGLSSLVIAAMCLRSGQVPPMPWLTQPMHTPCLNDHLTDQAQICDSAGSHAVFAMGFGGHVAGATLRGRCVTNV